MRYAYIENNVVKECIKVDPFSIFGHGYASLFIEVNDDVQAGWVVVDGEIKAPPKGN